MTKTDIKNLLKKKSVISLDIGGSFEPQKNFIVIDNKDLPSVDIKWEYDKYPYPFPNESVDFIKCSRVLEHISRENHGVIHFMDEMWRMLKPECQITIATPYGGAYEYFRDPCAVNMVNEATFAFFDPLDPLTNGGYYKFYKPKPWKIVTQLWNTLGLIEVLLEKRREDPSYLKDI
jgi:SAM-dependent methyltransferase